MRLARADHQSRTTAASTDARISKTTSRSSIVAIEPPGLLEQAHRHFDVPFSQLVRQARHDAGGDVFAEDVAALAPAPLELEQLLSERRVPLQAGDLDDARHPAHAVFVALDVDQQLDRRDDLLADG